MSISDNFPDNINQIIENQLVHTKGDLTPEPEYHPASRDGEDIADLMLSEDVGELAIAPSEDGKISTTTTFSEYSKDLRNYIRLLLCSRVRMWVDSWDFVIDGFSPCTRLGYNRQWNILFWVTKSATRIRGDIEICNRARFLTKTAGWQMYNQWKRKEAL